MTGPHLTPEREADLRADLADARAAAWEELAIPTSDLDALLAALDAERAAHQQARTALNASTSVMAQSLAWILRKTRGSDADMRFAREIDALVQANQRVLVRDAERAARAALSGGSP